MEFLPAEAFPVYATTEPEIKDYGSSQTLAYFISRTFNGSVYWDVINQKHIVLQRFQAGRPIIYLYTFTRPMNEVKNSASVVYFQATTSKEYLVLSASGLKYYVTFVDYVLPFQRSVWIGLIFISIVIALILRILFNSRNVFLLLFSFLLEQSDNISKKLANCCQFPYMLIPLLFMFLVLSNAYKGIVITSLVKPFEALGLNLAEGVRMGYKLYYMPENTREYENCCRRPEQFDAIVEESEKRGFTFMKDCADLIFMNSQFSRQLIGQNTFNFENLVDKMSEAGGRRRLSKYTSNSTNENLNLQLISLAEPMPCSASRDVSDKPYLKENEMFILEKSEAKAYLLRKEYGDIKYGGLYEMTDRTEVFPEVTIGFQVFPITFVRRPVLRNLMTYVEGGFQQNITSFIKFRELLDHVLSIRRKYGIFKHYLLNPKPLNFTSKITLTFIIYAICILLSIIVHGGEIVYSKRVIMAVSLLSAILKLKLMLFELFNRKMEQIYKCFLS